MAADRFDRSHSPVHGAAEQLAPGLRVVTALESPAFCEEHDFGKQLCGLAEDGNLADVYADGLDAGDFFL